MCDTFNSLGQIWSAMIPPHHLKENCCCYSHPVQLDLKGSVEGEIAMIVTTAPFQAVRTVVDVYVQGHCPLLGHCSTYWGQKEERI